MTETLSLFQLAEAACAKRPFVQVEQAVDHDDDEHIPEPIRKKVRFVGVEMAPGSDDEEPTIATKTDSSPPRELRKLMEKSVVEPNVVTDVVPCAVHRRHHRRPRMLPVRYDPVSM